MIIIQARSSLLSEKKYIFDVIFKNFLGFEYQLLNSDQSHITVVLPNQSSLVLNSDFWDVNVKGYLIEKALPRVTFLENNQFISEIDLPILYGNNEINLSKNSIECGVDIFAACFFMLSRMEEAIVPDRDNHNRFPATASVAYKNNFLDRPIVDEYVEFLWNMLLHLDPNLTRKERQATNFITCDVDWPCDIVRRSLKSTCRRFLGDVFRRKSLKLGLRTLKQFIYHQFKLQQGDHLRDTLSWMMDVNEEAGNKVAFYFITEYTHLLDSKTDFDSEFIRQIFREIHARGHEIGIHPGYNCYDNADNFQQSVQKLKTILEEEKIHQNTLGGRMHFLRWDIMQTPSLWEENNLDYDSSLSFADKAGFRCGTCHEFTMFDLNKRKAMNLKQRPLIVMEGTIIEDKYEGLHYSEESYNRFNSFKEKCQKYNGSYTLLWHNSFFQMEQDKIFYTKLIKEIL